MAIGTPVAGTPAANSVANTTLNVPYPSGVALGDELTLCVGMAGATASTNPAGWSSTANQTGTAGGSSPAFRISTKIADAADVSASASAGVLAVATPSNTSQGIMVSVPGVDQTTPIDVASPTPFGSSVSATAYTIPGVTTTMVGVLLLYCAVGNSSTGSYTQPTVPAAFTSLINNASPIPRFGVGYLIWSGSGATGNINLTATSTRGAAGLIALRPAAAAAVPPILVMPPRN